MAHFWPLPRWIGWIWAPTCASPRMAFHQQSASVSCSLCTVSMRDWVVGEEGLLFFWFGHINFAYLNIYSLMPGSAGCACSLVVAAVAVGVGVGGVWAMCCSLAHRQEYTKRHFKSHHRKYAVHFNIAWERQQLPLCPLSITLSLYRFLSPLAVHFVCLLHTFRCHA